MHSSPLSSPVYQVSLWVVVGQELSGVLHTPVQFPQLSLVAIQSSPATAFTDLKALHGVEVRVYIFLSAQLMQYGFSSESRKNAKDRMMKPGCSSSALANCGVAV